MKIVLGLIAFIFITATIYVVIGLSKTEDPAAVKAYIDSRGKKPIPPSIRDEVGKGI